VKTIAANWWRPTAVQIVDSLWQEDEFSKTDRAYDACLIRCLPDGRTTYVARRDEQDRLVIDGVEKGAYEKIGWLAYSPDGKRMALAVQVAGKWRLVLDGRLQKESYDELASERGYQAFTFSVDSKHFAFQASVAGKQMMVIDGDTRKKTDKGLSKLLDQFPRNTFGAFYFDVNREPRQINGYPVSDDLVPAGRQEPVASVLRDGRLERLWVNGTLSKPYTDVSTYLWCPIAGGVACVVKDGEKELMLAGGTEGKRYDKISYFRVSPDGKHLAYVAHTGDQQVVVFDGTEGAPSPKIDEYSLAFSPDGMHLAYRLPHDTGSSIVLDGKESPVYAFAYYPGFGPAGECYYITDDGATHQAIVAGLPGSTYDRIFDYRLFFDAPGKFHYFAKQGRDIVRVDETTVE
jgi:hypothetical protein